MTSVIPHTSPPAWPAGIASTRFASLVRTDDWRSCRIALLGLPDDLGVRLNSGRPGANDAPRAFRAALARLGVAQPAGWDWPRVFDAGDVVPAEGDTEEALAQTHDRVTLAAGALLDRGLFPIGVGGGHDLTFPFVRALAQRVSPLAGIYFDAHLDVREGAGSGMPFRRLVEECRVAPLWLHGEVPIANSRAHYDWFVQHQGTSWSRTPRPGAAPAIGPLPEGACFASFDLDVIDAAHAPGVSAMNPAGWSAMHAQAWCEYLGRDARVRCFDLMELSPPHDESGRTARLAAHLFLSFLRGFAERPR